MGFVIIRHARRARAVRADMRVGPDDNEYRQRAELEAAFWAEPPFGTIEIEAGRPPAMKQFENRSYTGDPEKSWLDDLLLRGPFRRAAMLGCAGGLYERQWLDSHGSDRLDIYDISKGAIRKTREQLWRRRFGVRWPDLRVRFFVSDLNFVCLGRERYDVVWSSGSLHHVTNLEYLAAEVERALRPGGLFAVHDYVGEKGLQYEAARLESVNEVFRAVPARLRRVSGSTVRAPGPGEGSPFEAVRADETLRVMQERFDVMHLARTEALFPLFLLLDLHAMEREAPQVLEAVFAAEETARRRPGARLCSAYAVFRKRQ